MVKSVTSSEHGAAVFEEGQTYEVVAGYCKGGFALWSDADDAALAVQARGDVEIVVHIEGHALGAA